MSRTDAQLKKLSDDIQRQAKAGGFDSVSLCRVEDVDALWGQRLHAAIAGGDHAQMSRLAETAERRQHPNALWPEARSALVVGLNYGPVNDPRDSVAETETAVISVYARNKDYHQLIKGRLKTLGSKFIARCRDFGVDADIKVFVDTAPLMEKPLAMTAGLGWLGKHTNLVSPDFGSWLFLGVLLTDIELPASASSVDHCGSCRACLDSCPTDAFPAPYRLNANRCISYLTIEHDGPIAADLRPLMGNRIFGCDDCLAACPWNKFAQVSREAKLQARPDLEAPRLQDLAALGDRQFRQQFAGSPIKRIGINRFLRNVLIAIGNSGEGALVSSAKALLSHESAMVRGAAIWAVRQLVSADDFAELRSTYGSGEHEPAVQQEWV